MDLSNGTLITYKSSKSKTIPGSPITHYDSKIFGLTQQNCNKGWGSSKNKCGIRLTRVVYDFICKETKDGVRGCTDHLLQLGNIIEKKSARNKELYA